MAFVNELIPPIEQETSEFFKQARHELNKHLVLSCWTVDRQNNRILNRSHIGREVETRNDEGWDYIDNTGRYSFWTTKNSLDILSPQEIGITRTINTVWEGSNSLAGMPSKETWVHIKEALETMKDYGVHSSYSTCKLTLILDGETL